MNENLQTLKESTKLKILSRYEDGILEKENADFLKKLIDEAKSKDDKPPPTTTTHNPHPPPPPPAGGGPQIPLKKPSRIHSL